MIDMRDYRFDGEHAKSTRTEDSGSVQNLLPRPYNGGILSIGFFVERDSGDEERVSSIQNMRTIQNSYNRSDHSRAKDIRPVQQRRGSFDKLLSGKID
ncbi:unnamed protein product, partial [Ceratitis capitata]